MSSGVAAATAAAAAVCLTRRDVTGPDDHSSIKDSHVCRWTHGPPTGQYHSRYD